MTRHILLIAPLLLTLSACATDHSAAISLGNAGVTATQALSTQTASMSSSVNRLGSLWGVRDTLACGALKAGSDLRASCLAGAAVAPKPALSTQLTMISDVLAKHQLAIDTLNKAYTAFVALAQYNAGQDATAKLKTAFTNINGFLSAVSALPGAAAISPISSTIQSIAGGVLSIAADSRQNREIAAANSDLETANAAMVSGLTVEKTATDSLLTVLEAEKASVANNALDAGMVQPTDIVSAAIVQIYPGIHVVSPPASNNDVLLATAKVVLKNKSTSSETLAPKTYDDAISTLNALQEQHQKLASDQNLNLTSVEFAVNALQADIAQMNATPAAAAPAAAAK